MSVKLKNSIVEVYSTDVKSQQEEAFLLEVLQTKFPSYTINFDLEDCDNILRVETQDASLDVDGIIAAIKALGFIAEVLPDAPNTHNLKEKKIPMCLNKQNLLPMIYAMVLISCGSIKTSDCIDKSKISDGPCTMQYDPVCGCDGKSYGNACQAERKGVVSWKQGECNLK